MIGTTQCGVLSFGMAQKQPVPPATPDDWARFMAKVQIQPDGCWHWTGATFTQGYGMFALGGKARRAHRVIYVWTHGEYETEHLDHTCHPTDGACPGGSQCPHRACVNPAHCAPVYTRHNTVEHSMGPSAINAQKTHCIRGHPLSGDNLWIDPAGWRQCRMCKEARYRAAHPNQNNRDKTHCKNGHLLSGDNVKPSGRGDRVCRTCARERNLAWWRRKKGM